MKIRFRCPAELSAVLPRPVPAKRALPEWLKQMPMTVYSPDLDLELPSVKQCPPFIDAMSFGFMMPLPVDLHVDREVFEWDWRLGDDPGELPASAIGNYHRSPIGYHANSQAIGTPFFEEGRAIIKFFCHWTVELEPGYSLYVIHPANRLDLPFRTISGLVDCDLYKDNFVNFPALWVDPEFRGVLEKGTPVAQCLVVEREAYDLAFDVLSDEAALRYRAMQKDIKADQHAYRNRYRAKKA